MNEIIIIYCIILLLLLYYFLIKAKQIKNYDIIESVFDTDNIKQELIIKSMKNVIRQQRISFAIFLVSISVTILIGLILLWTTIITDKLSDKLIYLVIELLGMGSGGICSNKSYQLYCKATKKLETFMFRE